MKSKLMGLLAATVLFASCGTTTTSTTTTSFSNEAYIVPETIRTSFTTRYPGATNVTWTSYDGSVVPIDWELTGWTVLDSNDHAVQFDMNNQRYMAWYDTDGTWIGSTYRITDHTVLPVAIHNVLNKDFAGYKIDEVNEETWNDKKAYEIELTGPGNKVKLLMDANGTIIKRKDKEK